MVDARSPRTATCSAYGEHAGMRSLKRHDRSAEHLQGGGLADGRGGSGQPGADPEVARPVAPDVSGPDVLGVEPEMEPECRSVDRVLVCGPLATAAVALVIDVLSRTPLYIPNPHPILLTAVIYAAFVGGLAAGASSAAVMVAYTAYYLSRPGRGSSWTRTACAGSGSCCSPRR